MREQAPGGPRRSLGWLALIAAGAGPGCTDLPSVASAICGNGVVEPGESCDRPGPGCGAPGSAAPCRFTCESGACSQPGFQCGPDHACRRATGTFTLAPPIGGFGDRFEVLDIDGDGALDIADRGVREASFFRNDGHGAFHLYAVGAVSADSTVTRAFAAGHVGTDRHTLLSVIGGSSLDLFSVSGSGAIAPLAFAQTAFPPGGRQQFLGALQVSPDATALPLFFDPANVQLLALDLDPPLTTLALDLHALGATAASAVISATAIQPSGLGTAALAIDRRTVVAIDVGDHRSIEIQPLSTGGFFAAHPDASILQLLLGDLDGDRGLDLVAIAAAPDPATTSGFSDMKHLLWWLRAPDGKTFHSVEVSEPYLLVAPVSALGDLNGDGHADLANQDHVHLGRPPSPDGGPFECPWTDGGDGDPSSRSCSQLVPVNLSSFGEAMAAGDLDRDGAADLVFTGDRQGSIVTCRSDASPGPRFTCFPQSSALAGISSLTLQDLDGDRVQDVVAVEGAAPGDGGVGEGRRLAVAFGSAQGFPGSQAQLIDVYRASAVGAAGSPTTAGEGILGEGLGQLIVALALPDRVGVALAHGIAGAAPVFGVPFPTFEARFVNGQLVVLTCAAVGYYTDCKVELFHGDGPDVFANPDSRALAIGLDAQLVSAYSAGLRLADLPGDPLPAALWLDRDTLLVGHIGSGPVAVASVPSPKPFVTGTVDMPSYVWEHLDAIDVDGPADPAGDGRNEIVVVQAESLGGPCVVLVGRIAAGAAAPTALAQVASIPGCVHVDRNLIYSDFGTGRPFFVPRGGAAGSDGGSATTGPLAFDLIQPVVGDDGRQHLARLLAQPDGTWGAPALDPAIVRASPAGPVGPLVGDYAFIDRVDLNGDGIPDLVFATPGGAVIALADFELE